MKTVTLGALKRMYPTPSMTHVTGKYQYYWCPATDDPMDTVGMVNGKMVKIKRDYVERMTALN